MSRLTPVTDMTSKQFESLLDIVHSGRMSLRQYRDLLYAIYLDDEAGTHVSWINNPEKVGDCLAQDIVQAQYDREAEPYEEPYMGATIGAEDQPRGAL